MATTRNNIPPSTTIGKVFGKVFSGLFVGALLGFVLFFLLSFVGNSLDILVSGADMASSASGSQSLLAVLLLVVTLVSTFVGVIIMAAIYSMFYGDEYYDFGSLFRYGIMTNITIFVFFIPIYLIFMSSLNALFFVMALHIALVVYVCMMQMEIMINPHYAVSASIGATFGLVIAMLIYAAIISLVSSDSIQASLHWYIVLPPVLMYGFIPLGIGFWKLFYTRLYETGSDILYVPSPAELTHNAEVKETEDEEEVNVNR